MRDYIDLEYFQVLLIALLLFLVLGSIIEVPSIHTITQVSL
jgi:hypothetical protein